VIGLRLQAGDVAINDEPIERTVTRLVSARNFRKTFGF
jgi:hypothetical protein